jgi:hypothetical protein
MALGLRAVLGFDDRTLHRSLEHHGTLGPLADAVSARLSAGGRDEVGGQVSATVGHLLDMDLGAMLVSGWQTYGALHTAARNTVAAPGSSDMVHLASQEVRWDGRPTVDVYISGARVYRLELTITVLLELHSLVATVRRGRLVGLRSGRCKVTVRVSWSGGVLIEREGRFELPLAVTLGAGIPLLLPGTESTETVRTVRGSAP